MRLANVRPLAAPAAVPLRAAAALDPEGRRWLVLETARLRALAARPSLAQGILHGAPVGSLDDHLARGLRLAALEELVAGFAAREADPAIFDAADLRFGPPILRPPSFRDFYAFERHAATTFGRTGRRLPQTWYRVPVFYFQDVAGIRGDGDPVHAPHRSVELDYEAEVAAVIDTPAADLPEDRAEEAIGGYVILNDWSARDLQREENELRMGAAKGKDFATSIGPWLVTPDEVADRRPAGAPAPSLAITATVRTGDGRTIECTRGDWGEIHHSLGSMAARASADTRLRPGDLLGSGTVGGGCLLEVKDSTLGRWLLPGDEVTLEVERLGRLVTPIVARPGAPRGRVA
jgi:fumarylacetoacetate (FAA) hydrolase